MGLAFHFLRHGETTQSRENVFCGSGLDPELTPDGVEMTLAFASAYKSFPFSAVYSSPSRRAVATARPISQALGLKVIVKEGLKEIGFGQWEGKTAKSVDEEFHQDFIRWTANPARSPPTGGEKADEVAERGVRIVQEIQSGIPGGDVLIVSHKATIRIILCSLLGMNVGRYRHRLACPVASISVLEIGGQGYLLRSLADRAHLTERLRNLPGT